MQLQNAVVVEYSFRLHDSHMHGFAMQVVDDVSVPASFVGISPSGPHAILPKLEAGPSFRQRLGFRGWSLGFTFHSMWPSPESWLRVQQLDSCLLLTNPGTGF